MTSSQHVQAEASSKGDQLRAAQQALTEATAAHERYVIEAEAQAKSEAAEAVRLKIHELMQQKEALDRLQLCSCNIDPDCLLKGAAMPISHL